MDLLSGVYAAPVLDGYPLTNVQASERQVRGSVLKSTIQAADGTTRLQLTYLGEDAPLVRPRRVFVLRWEHAAGMRDLLARILADPGTHRFALWRPEYLVYVGDGSRREWLLPWPSAVDLVAVPAGLPSDPVQPEVRLGIDGAPLTVSSQPTAAYDAGTPASGACWVEDGGLRFKVANAPAAGARVHVRLVPYYTVVEGAQTEQTIRRSTIEPRQIELVEI